MDVSRYKLPPKPEINVHFLIFKTIYFRGIEPKYFSSWVILHFFPDLNVLERVLIAVKFLAKNIEKQKSYPRFPRWVRSPGAAHPPPRDCEVVL